MKADQRVMLDRRIADERFTELEPHEARPDWASMFDIQQPKAWTMTSDGTISRSWVYLDEVSWSDVVAIKIEDIYGRPLDPLDLEATYNGDYDYEG